MNLKKMILLELISLTCFPCISYGLTLEKFWNETVMHDPTVRLYREQLEAAHEAEPLAMAELLPHLSFGSSIEWNTHRITKPVNKYDPDSVILARKRNNYIGSWYVALKQAIFNWSAIQKYNSSQYQVAAAAEIYQKSMQRLEKKVIDAYITWQASYANLLTLQRSDVDIKKQVYDAQKRFKYGTSGILGAEEAQVSLAQINAEIQNAKATYYAAAQSMKTFTGRMPPNIAPKLPRDLHIYLLPKNKWVDFAERHNPALASAKYQLKAAQRNVSAANGGFLPDLSLIISHQWRTENGNLEYNYGSMPGTPAASGSGIPDPHSYNGTSVMIEMQWPLYLGGSQQAGLAQAQYKDEASFSTLLAIKRKILANLNSSFEQVIRNKERVKIYHRSLLIARQATQRAIIGLQAGLVSENNALTDRQAEISVKKGLNDATAMTIKYYASLAYSAGILSPIIIHNLSLMLSEH